MKCYVHTSVDAIGVCKACQKGLCRECAVDAGHAITCKGNCESIAADYEASRKRTSVTYQTATTSWYQYPMFVLLTGGAFLVWGIETEGFGMNFMVILGAIFFAFGLVRIIVTLRWVKQAK